MSACCCVEKEIFLRLTEAEILLRRPAEHSTALSSPFRRICVYPTLQVWQADRWRGLQLRSPVSPCVCVGMWLYSQSLVQCVILLHVPLVVRWSSMESYYRAGLGRGAGPALCMAWTVSVPDPRPSESTATTSLRVSLLLSFFIFVFLDMLFNYFALCFSLVRCKQK